ncbi:Gfo/Idh/MocA family protein [Paenibacillus eucommiae]|uniref:Dehydrogenase n=1 Tax=Paenibacillus eucommiae TaxID=1355755 RepID=A0ABS4J3P7_9BACL|nr:Gfo/Idh/MocA family oxidoreductase [Paenibacillus eucommiae]MBP1994438.1 putative dehydrogenase [Paenibacillus eucommiae]
MYQAAVIGLGNIGLQFDIPRKAAPQSHVLAYHLNPDIDLVAAVGVRQEQGDRLAQVAPETKFYMDLITMLNNHRLDVISICTPQHIRLELLRTVFEHSEARIIFLEKPVATSIQEAEAIASLAEQYGRTVVVNLSRRWSDGATRIREALRSGQYGKLKKIHLRYTRGIYNTGSHMFDLVRFTVGSMEQVKVLQQIPTNLDEREDWTYSFTFTLEDGAVTGYAEAFDDRDFLIFEMDLYLEKGKIEMLKSGDEIRFYEIEEHPIQKGLNHLVPKDLETGMLYRSSSISNAVSHLVDILKNGTTPISTLEDGIYPLYAADAVIRSHAKNGTVENIQARG